MPQQKAAPWIAGTAFVSLIILIATWFFGITPRNQEASDLHEQAESVEQQNLILQAEVAALKAQFDRIDEYREQIATIRRQIPEAAAIDSFNLEVAELIEHHELTLLLMNLMEPTTFMLAERPLTPAEIEEEKAREAEAEKEAKDAKESGGSAAADKGTSTAEDREKEAPPGFTAIPFTVTLMGEYSDAVAFLADLQKNERIVLVTGIRAEGLEESVGSGGRPPSATGFIDFTVAGYIYAMPELDPQEPAEPENLKLPRPEDDANPFVPIDGIRVDWEAADGEEEDD